MGWTKTSLIKFVEMTGCPTTICEINGNKLTDYQQDRAMLIGEYIGVSKKDIHEENIKYIWIGKDLYLIQIIDGNMCILVQAYYHSDGSYHLDIGRIAWERYIHYNYQEDNKY